VTFPGNLKLTTFPSRLLFIGSLVLAAVVLSKNRKDLRGAKYNSGMDPDGNPLPDHAGAASVAMGNVPNQPQYHSDPPKNEYYQQPPTPQPYQPPTPQPYQPPTPQPYQPTTSPVYYNASATTQPISPPATPAPYSQGIGYPGGGVGVPPPPPPINAAEMPTR